MTDNEKIQAIIAEWTIDHPTIELVEKIRKEIESQYAEKVYERLQFGDIKEVWKLLEETIPEVVKDSL